MVDSENHENPSEDKREAIKSWKYFANEYCPTSADVLTRAKNSSTWLEAQRCNPSFLCNRTQI